MQNDVDSHDPFNWTYLIAALVTLLALPLMHDAWQQAIRDHEQTDIQGHLGVVCCFAAAYQARPVPVNKQTNKTVMKSRSLAFEEHA